MDASAARAKIDGKIVVKSSHTNVGNIYSSRDRPQRNSMLSEKESVNGCYCRYEDRELNSESRCVVGKGDNHMLHRAPSYGIGLRTVVYMQ